MDWGQTGRGSNGKITVKIMEKSNLPTLQDLNQDLQVAFKNDAFNALVNSEVPAKWTKPHPFARKTVNGSKVPIEYLPIDKVEYLMTKIFQIWNVEVKSVQQLFNSVSVSVRIHYRNPVTGEMQYHDGVGAVGVQTDAGASAADLSAIKQDAIMKALPAAKSYAIKDACEHIGKLFGRDLNRTDTLAHSMTYENPDNQDLVELFELKKENMSAEDIVDAERIINNKEINSYKKLHQKLSAI